jgi:c(7)-type cytochrome triheme protein
MKRFVGWLLVVAAAGPVAAAEQPAVKKRRPLPAEYGMVVINNYSAAAKLAPVVFDHWSHRARFTCRLCHVDVGFAMKAGATNIKAADNMKGLYCGACHDGQRLTDGRSLFESCGKAFVEKACVRCHSLGKGVRPELDFAGFAKSLPRERFGNGIDWERAEIEKRISPSDYLEGISIKRAPITAQKDFALAAKLQGMPDIVFSHAKHTVWNGCEVCHPDIFAVKKGGTKFTMVQIFEGQSCGACHASVAFPLIDCQRCHAKPVQ